MADGELVVCYAVLSYTALKHRCRKLYCIVQCLGLPQALRQPWFVVCFSKLFCRKLCCNVLAFHVLSIAWSLPRPHPKARFVLFFTALSCRALNFIDVVHYVMFVGFMPLGEVVCCAVLWYCVRCVSCYLLLVKWYILCLRNGASKGICPIVCYSVLRCTV